MRSIRIGSWDGSCASVLVTCVLVVACGGDDDGDDDGIAETTGTATVGTSDDTMTADSTTSGVDESSTSGVDTTSETSGGETTEGTDESTSEGGPEDPSYPPTDDGGTCPNGTAPIQLPGASVCGPFCDGPDAACPAPASGDAVPTCTPFEQKGGSGDPCRTHDECPEGEACDTDNTCVAVAFWACRLVCADGESCSDGMTCAAGACGYP